MPNDSPFRLPSPSDHIVICGHTGSGKSQAAMWQLSLRDIDVRPWIIVDYKDDPDDLINNIEKSTIITFSDPLPTKPGIYILKCDPDDEDELREWFKRVKRHRNLGIYVDECAMIGRYNKPFNACMAQGRSLKISFINLTQRPVEVSKLIFSEAKFWQVFNLIKTADRKTVASDVPISVDYKLPEFYSYYYDVAKSKLFRLKPVPDGEQILAMIDAKLPRLRRTL